MRFRPIRFSRRPPSAFGKKLTLAGVLNNVRFQGKADVLTWLANVRF